MRTQRLNWENEELERQYGGKGFYNYTQQIYTKDYSDYIVEVEHTKTYHDNGDMNEHYSVFLLQYDSDGWLIEVHCLKAMIYTMPELWQFIAGLELEVTSSDFQYLESLRTFQDLVKYEVGGFAELEGIDTKTGDLWLFIPIDNHHIEAWKKLYIGEGRYEDNFQYIETINWWNMTPLERKKALGWSY